MTTAPIAAGTAASASPRYPWPDLLPAEGGAVGLLPGLKWVRMPLPFALDHINLWLLRDASGGHDGWTVVDCGLANDRTQQAWERVFASELEGLPVRRVIATHLHPDHIGLADWLTRRWSTPEHACRLWMSAGDYFAARVAMQPGSGGERAATWFRSHGLTDTGALDRVRQRGDYFASMVPALPAAFRRLRHGDRLTIGMHEWRCIAGFGHAPEHQSLYGDAQRVLIAGDMLLPRISTNVSVTDWEPEGDPLRDYLDSLGVLLDLPADTLVLPSHGLPFGGPAAADGQGGLHTRIAQLQRHHADRLADTLAQCRRQASSAADLLPVLFRRELDLHQTTFALGEALAHLNHLWLRGDLLRQQDDDGIWRFRA